MKVENRTPETVHIGRVSIAPGGTVNINQAAKMWIESTKGGAELTIDSKGNTKIDSYGHICVAERQHGRFVIEESA